MIIWINGPYGVGKTTLAKELCKKTSNGFIFDAEKVGDAVRDNMPEEFFKETFEEFTIWHESCYKLLKNLDSVYDGTVLVPMTLVFPESVREIIDKFRGDGISVVHIMLETDEETIRERILARGKEEGCWCMENIGRCLSAQKDMPADLRIDASEKTPEEIAYEVLKVIK